VKEEKPKSSANSNPGIVIPVTGACGLSFIDVVYNSSRQPVVRGPLMVREKIVVVCGEIWALFAIFMFIILFYYIIILFETSSNKYH
jgi:hypothetical protein